MKKYLIAGNWKMHGTKQSVCDLVASLAKLNLASNVDVAVFPTYLHIDYVAQSLSKSTIKVGAQNCAYQEKQGALTGEISAEQLKDIGCKMVLIGHSERRQYLAEANQVLAKKFIAACSVDLVPILCVGETLEQRSSGNYQNIITNQISSIIDIVGIELFSKAIIAYEPIWAIGTGMVATSIQAQEVHLVIRNFLANINTDLANNMQILYGGSLNSTNIKDLLGMPDIDGGLIGGASLSAQDFSLMCNLAGEIN